MHLSRNSSTLFQRVNNPRLTSPQFLCQQGFKIDKFCCNTNCRFEALTCSQEECTVCLAHHEECNFKSMVQLIKKWQARANKQKDLAKRFFQIQKEAMGKLIKAQELFMESIQQGNFEPHSQILREIQLRNGNSGICGQQMSQIFDSLCTKQEVDAAEVIRNYQGQIGKMLITIENERETLFQNCFRDQQVNKLQQYEPIPSKLLKVVSDDIPSSQVLIVEHIDISPQDNLENAVQQCSQEQQSSTFCHSPTQKNEPSYQQEQDQSAQSRKYPTIEQRVQSVILNNDPNGQSKKDFLFYSLDNPKQLQLIFRASQNRFRASKFHEACDGIDDTVSIVLTEPGCIVAGWTRLKWSQPNYWLKQAKKGDAFLLQLDLKEKYLPKKQHIKKSVYGHERFGPSFGSDLVISDECDFNLDSRSSFPQFYNHPTKKYRPNKKSKALLCGCEEDNFKILQYEVFKVIRE